mmetsp:Transcript_109489/g.217434  ORF Transcript_109489/g.217434 Transcript_109489/m.217434 type:complete len:136 (-) Transcript_109489:140-547(-)|eukprot:CAMPEP_0172718242 /NCGR_PEP_ID=MMETSP1074-20121228/73796_1 /TAXON_ID=2916 /ORGANISM="Ceratium fusus, Strain PA161109" /LENGTH=135 /DNA_ID=CAMNT_0013543373 /DNA_START=167 /DNA_END=574 /DNA_ORIENTATION=-
MVSLSLWVLAAIMPMGTAIPDPFKCVCHACLFKNHIVGTDYAYYKTTKTTRSQCEAACFASSKCTGFEHPDDESYCAFWYGGACALQDGTTAKFVDWASGKTCTKQKALASHAAPSAVQLFPMLLLGSSFLAFLR